MKIRRFPQTSNNSLKAWSAADEYLLQKLEHIVSSDSSITIINDRFGYLSLHLNENNPKIICHFKSQEDAIKKNYTQNGFDESKIDFASVLDEAKNLHDIVLMKIPKSMDLFHLFLIKIHAGAKEETKVLCGFMTRHFTKQMLEIASQYFEIVEQGLASKKSRVLALSKPKKEIKTIVPIHNISYLNHRAENLIFKQYYGVFSAKHIDYATQFLIENITIDPTIEKALDLASGNGVIAHELRTLAPNAEIHLLDDSYLAIESSKMNVLEGNNHFHYTYTMDHFDDDVFDLVVCNPPFHFDHENTIEIALNMFQKVSRILKPNGSFILVSNLHLNYKTHLSQIYKKVEVINMNSKFEIIKCDNN